MSDLDIVDKTLQILMIISTVVGAASMIFQGILQITKITPSKKDDEFAGKIVKTLAWVQTLLDKLALNPKAK